MQTRETIKGGDRTHLAWERYAGSSEYIKYVDTAEGLTWEAYGMEGYLSTFPTREAALSKIHQPNHYLA